MSCSGCNCFCRAMKCRPVVHARFTAVSWLIAFVYRGMINDVTLWVLPSTAPAPIIYSSFMFPYPMCIHLHFPIFNFVYRGMINDVTLWVLPSTAPPPPFYILRSCFHVLRVYIYTSQNLITFAIFLTI